jgi:hypothetical protein
MSQVGLDSRQRRTAVILVASSRASFSGRSRNLEGRQPGQTRVERGAVARADEQKRRIDRLARPRIFDREPRLADPAETVKRDRGALGAQQRLMHVGKVLIAAGEQAAERCEGKVAGSAGWRQRPSKNGEKRLYGACSELIGVREADLRVDPDFAQSSKMRGLRLFDRVGPVGRPAFGRLEVVLRNQKRLAVVQRQPCLPLRVGDRGARIHRRE